ncbi:hypothetical protein B0H14DRAFT_3480216 [Mycena olivaceomarginata]|nr:hypothetical protein B0H14DRAFT_3480216 [Mycena olivaceomarginata]
MSNGIAPAPSLSGYAASGAAGPPPVLSHGYSSSLGPFANPGASSAVANSGNIDPDSPFATSSNPHLASTSYPSRLAIRHCPQFSFPSAFHDVRRERSRERLPLQPQCAADDCAERDDTE